MAPVLLLTRPDAQSRALVTQLAWDGPVLIAPVMRIVATGPGVDLGPYAGVILTSANAVEYGPDLANISVYCVGKRTSEAAERAGARVHLVARDADDLVATIKARAPLLHLCGHHHRGDIAKRLKLAGIETHQVEVYDQSALPLTDAARNLIEGDARVVVPLFSPRTARLVGATVARVGPHVHVIAMSKAVAESWRMETGQDAEVCAQPSGAQMRARINAALRT